jgi:hypothetical protein
VMVVVGHALCAIGHGMQGTAPPPLGHLGGSQVAKHPSGSDLLPPRSQVVHCGLCPKSPSRTWDLGGSRVRARWMSCPPWGREDC